MAAVKPEKTMRIDTDVVVVGSGGAGLCAAAAARRAGAEVVLVTKGRLGLANATAYAGGGFTVSSPSARPSTGGSPHPGEPDGDEALTPEILTPEEHFRLSLRAGRFLNDRTLLTFLCERGPGALGELERDFGVKFDWSRGRGCSVARFGRPPLLGGLGLTGPLARHVREAGVRVIERAVVTSVVRDEDGVLGVMAVLPGCSDPVLELHAPAVVVATGGGGAVYGRTDNPPRMTGDGYTLLLRAGAVMRDMEFVQFYPLSAVGPRLVSRPLDTSLLDIFRLTDENGDEPLAGKYEEWGVESGTEINLFARDKAAVALSRHLEAGHRLYLHTEEVFGPGTGSTSDAVRAALEMLPSYVDPAAGPIPVAPVQHYFCGGAVISRDGEVLQPSGDPLLGLFACGECTGGVDGANRVGGNALTNIVVFGLAAGEAAARRAGGMRVPGARAGGAVSGVGPARRLSRGRGPSESWERARGELTGLLRGWECPASGRADPERDPLALRSELRRLSERRLGPVRDRAGLEEALANLADLERRVPTLAPQNPADLLVALEMSLAVPAAALTARAALTRTESRGSHFRKDYPVEDPEWERPVLIGPDGRPAGRLSPASERN